MEANGTTAPAATWKSNQTFCAEPQWRHGEFEALAAMYCRLGTSQRKNAMKVYREYGEKATAVAFSAIALIELTRAPDPQAALAEAEARADAGEEITKQAARDAAGRASMRPTFAPEPPGSGRNPTPHKKGEHAAGTGPAATT